MLRPANIALLAGIAACHLISSASVRADLLIYHFNVNQGDATLFVNTESQRTLLVDAGNIGYGRRVIVPALQSMGISQLNYFIASHYDADHIAGFDEVVAGAIPITDAIFDRGDRTDRKTETATGRVSQYGEYLNAANAGNRVTLEPACAPPIDLGQGVVIEVVASGGLYLLPDCSVADRNVSPTRDNDLSIALVVRYGDFSYFVGGDLTGGGNGTIDMEALVAPRVGDVDVLKINHHGSETSSSRDFLRILSPEVAIISVGNGGVNKTYGLPAQSALDRLSDLDHPPIVFLTNQGEGGEYDGSYIEDRHIVIHTNGHGYSVNGILFAVDERQVGTP